MSNDNPERARSELVNYLEGRVEAGHTASPAGSGEERGQAVPCAPTIGATLDSLHLRFWGPPVTNPAGDSSRLPGLSHTASESAREPDATADLSGPE